MTLRVLWHCVRSFCSNIPFSIERLQACEKTSAVEEVGLKKHARRRENLGLELKVNLQLIILKKVYSLVLRIQSSSG